MRNAEQCKQNIGTHAKDGSAKHVLTSPWVAILLQCMHLKRVRVNTMMGLFFQGSTPLAARGGNSFAMVVGT